jgi:hypothetical protein
MKNSILFLVSFLCVNTLFAQETAIRGKVVDEDNLPLPGVAVVVDGTTTGTLTNAAGEFTLTINKSTARTISCSFVGYTRTSQSVVEGKTFYEFTMAFETTELDAVVVIGYGTQRKGDVTVSISSVKAKELDSPAITSLDQSLQGQSVIRKTRSSRFNPDKGNNIY